MVFFVKNKLLTVFFMIKNVGEIFILQVLYFCRLRIFFEQQTRKIPENKKNKQKNHFFFTFFSLFSFFRLEYWKNAVYTYHGSTAEPFAAHEPLK